MQHQARTRRGAVALLLILAMLTVMVAALVPFVSSADGDEFQDFGYQAPKSYSMIDANSNLRFVCTIPADKLSGYTAAGFVFSKTVSTPSVGADGCATAYASTVYSSIMADGKTYNADPGRFWLAVKLTDIPRSYFDGPIYVRAFATDGAGTRYSSAEQISVWEAHPAIEYHSNWDLATRNASEYSIQNPDYPSNNDYKTFGIKESAKSLYSGDVRYFPKDNNEYAGNDLLVEFSFLYNDTMSNASDGTLTVMYIENNNVFNINLKTGMISNNERTGDVVLYEKPDLSIGGYGWHRFGVRIHQNAINNNGVEDYQIVATAYLDGEKILEVDKTAYAKTKTGSYTGKLFSLEPYTNRMIYGTIPSNKNCDVYVMIEKIYKSSANAGYLVLQDLSISCGQTFKQQVTKVADPVSQTYKTTDGETLPAKVYFAAAEAHEHVWDGVYTITKPATLLENGWKSEHCSICGAGHAVVSTPSETTPVVINGKDASAPTGWGSSKNFFSPQKSLKDIAAEEGHFYPTNGNPEGNDLLVEFSVLWNSTLSAWGSGKSLDLGNFSGGDVNSRSTSWLYVNNGSIELSDGDGGVVLVDTGKSVSGYGWHRIGIRYHQDAAKDGANVVYTLTYTLYIDGVEAYKVIGGASRYVNQGYRLFDAEIVDDELVYKDNQDSKYKYFWLQLQSFFGRVSDTYLVLADLMINAGHDFAQQVEPAASPVASPINLGAYDSELMYYKLAD